MRTGNRAIISALVAFTAMGFSCGGSSPSPIAPGNEGFGGQVELPSAASCTGPVPANATICQGADSELTIDTPNTVLDACTCDVSCRATIPCSYACNAGYIRSDGACQPVTPPSAVRFADNGDGTVTVTDHFGALVWLKAANCYGPVPWFDAAGWTGALANGSCGLRDLSSSGDWRLPTQTELMNLAVDLTSAAYEAAGSPFTGISTDGYWTSFSTCTYVFGVVDVNSGQYFDRSQDLPFDVWPVRRQRL